MLDILHRAEKALPSLMKEESEWNSVFVDYHPPFVERLWRQWGDYRIYLHRIHPCRKEEALFHPHPWPSAMRVIKGSYEMAVGYGAGDVAPPIAMTLVIGPDVEYEMTDPDTWHYVRPLYANAAYSVMVTGKPWNRSAPRSDKKLEELSHIDKYNLLQFFAIQYYGRKPS